MKKGGNKSGGGETETEKKEDKDTFRDIKGERGIEREGVEQTL